MKTDKIKKSYWSVTPANVRYCKNIPDGAKLLYGEITALCNERGYCWASNDYFAELYGKDSRTMQRWIKALESERFIYCEVKGKERKIFLAQKFEFSAAGLDELPEEEGESESAGEAAAPVSKKKEKKAEVVKYNEDDMRLAQLLLSKIIYNFPAFENKKVKLSEWAEDVRKLREIDKATAHQIEFMITWLQGGEIVLPGGARTFEPHEFWSKNILSARKLRKQWFENLVPQLQDTLKKGVKKHAVTQL